MKKLTLLFLFMVILSLYACQEEEIAPEFTTITNTTARDKSASKLPRLLGFRQEDFLLKHVQNQKKDFHLFAIVKEETKLEIKDGNQVVDVEQIDTIQLYSSYNLEINNAPVCDKDAYDFAFSTALISQELENGKTAFTFAFAGDVVAGKDDYISQMMSFEAKKTYFWKAKLNSYNNSAKTVFDKSSQKSRGHLDHEGITTLPVFLNYRFETSDSVNYSVDFFLDVFKRNRKDIKRPDGMAIK